MTQSLSWDRRWRAQGTFPEPLEPAANSIVCTDNTAMLRDVFNQTYGTEHDIRFPAKKCRTAASRCQQCVRQSRCTRNGEAP